MQFFYKLICENVCMSGVAVLEYVVVVLLWTAGLVCSAVVDSCCSAFRRDLKGTLGGHGE